MSRIVVSLLFVVFAGILSACSQRVPVEVEFDARFVGEPIACSGLASSPAMSDLRLYLYDVRVDLADGTSAALMLADDGIWQDGSVAFIDLEDGTGSCLNGTPAVNRRLQGSLPAGSGAIAALSFTLGVPETVNHADPMLADPPLNNSIMHWHWRSGYKFMRAGVELPDDAAWLHLGSSQCAGTIGRIEGCSASNRALVRITDFDPARQRIGIDLERLFAPSDLADGQGWDCQSGPAERQCAPVFQALGLSFTDGAVVGPTPVFRAVAKP